MGPAVVLGRDLGDGAGPVSDGPVADLAAGDRKLGNGHGKRREGDLRRAQPGGLDRRTGLFRPVPVMEWRPRW
jgi:hypothetical protein